MADDSDLLREMLTNTVATGDIPTAKQLMTIGLTGTIAERKRGRGGLTSAFQDLARRSTRGEDLSARVDDIVNRYAPTEIHDPAELVKDIPHTTPSWQGRKEGEARNSDRTALGTLTSAISHSALSKSPMSTDDLAHLEPSASMSPTQQSAWRASVWEASQRVAAIAEAGRHEDARRAARDLAGTLSDGLQMPEPVDPSEAARRPDGTYDPAQLAAGIPR